MIPSCLPAAAFPWLVCNRTIDTSQYKGHGLVFHGVLSSLSLSHQCMSMERRIS